MGYEIKEITADIQKPFYETFPCEKSFLQGAKFGNFRKKVGEKIIRWGIYEDEILVGTAQIQKIKTRLKTYLHIPHGPLLLPPPKRATDDIKNEMVVDEALLKFFLEEYIKLGEKEQCDLVRIAPLFPPNFSKLFTQVGYKPSAIHLANPEKTWVLNIKRTEDEILANMKKSTRYEVRRGPKCGIEVIQGNTEKDLDIFWHLHTETVKRQGFVPFPRKHTEQEMAAYGIHCLIFSGKIEDDFLSSSVILYDDRAGYYHQGASVYSKAPVSHATLWAAILEAKERGCTEFNFWGVCEEDNKKHPWHGLSKFKRGFGGEERNFMHVHEYPLTWKSRINSAVEKWRKWRRGY